MVRSSTLNQIIQHLGELQLEQSCLTAQLESITSEGEEDNSVVVIHQTSSSNQAQSEPQVRRGHPIPRVFDNPPPIQVCGAFTSGEHIFVRNKLLQILNALPFQQVAVITDITFNQVDFTTYTGISTWRSPRNIRRLDQNKITCLSRQAREFLEHNPL